MIPWERVARANTHPLSIRILEYIDASPEPVSPTMLAREFGMPLANIAYHVTVLHDGKMLRLTKTKARRGAVEHFYRLRKDTPDAD